MQCWDSKLVYSYFRLTGDNRLLLGGGTPITTFLKDAYNNPRVIRQGHRGFQSHFPELSDLSFMQFWPGQIDATRDLLPVIEKPPEQPHIRFILGCVGIPWATFCGSFAARNVLGDADEDYKKYFNYFSNQRHFALPSSLGKVIGKPILFSLSNAWAKFYQVDTLRRSDETERSSEPSDSERAAGYSVSRRRGDRRRPAARSGSRRTSPRYLFDDADRLHLPRDRRDSPKPVLVRTVMLK